MAINNLLTYTNNVSLARQARIRRSISTGGYVRQQTSGPSFYTLTANLKPLTLTEYNQVEAELLQLQDGVQLITGETLNTNFALNGLQGNFNIDGNNIPEPALITQSTSNGTSIITINNLDNGGTVEESRQQLLPGDYIQIAPYTKVYQVVRIIDLDTFNNNTIQIELNQRLVNDINEIQSSNTIRVGNDVQFQFILENRPEVTVIPGPGFNYYQYETFNFREILNN